MVILEQKTVTIRKPCRCFGCSREFQKGSRLQKITAVDQGEFLHSAWCEVCQEYWSQCMENDDEINEGGLKSEDPEVWESIRKEVEEDK